MSSPLESRVEKDLAAITYSSGPTVKPQSRVEELLVALYNKIGPGSNVYFDPETNQLVFDDTSVYVDDDGYLVTNGTVDNDGYLNF